MAKLEFYIGDSAKFIATCEADAVPREGEFINIRGETYMVSQVTWALDHSDSPRAALRANVVLQDPLQALEGER